jgi:hypothetical protein
VGDSAEEDGGAGFHGESVPTARRAGTVEGQLKILLSESGRRSGRIFGGQAMIPRRRMKRWRRQPFVVVGMKQGSSG